MNYNLSVLKHFLTYSNYSKWKDKLNIKDLPSNLQPVYSILSNFHETHEQDLSVADLANLVLAHQQKDPDYYNAVLETLESLDVSSTSVEVLLTSLHEQKLLKEIALSAYDLTEGKGKKEAFDKLIQEYAEGKHQSVVTTDCEFVSDDIEELLEQTYRQPGLRWRLNTLNKMLGSLRGGDFGFIFARPETGKTTFLASEVTCMASQLSDDSGPIIWFNNEEKGTKVKIRCYQAALGATLAQINSNPVVARQRYLEKTKGKLLLPDIRGSISKSFVEQVCRQYKPSLVIFDQIDAITGFDADREDLKLGAIYLWARDLGKELNYATIAVCQADGSGEGQKWLTMANVANAKTSKQAQADWIVGIGKIHDVGYENLRFLHASKNKLSGDEDTDPALRHGKCEVLIKPEIARYADLN